MKDFFKTGVAMLAMTAFAVSGCADPSSNEQFSEVTSHENEQPDQDPHAGHAHPTHGPHGGDLIELGNEEYHAELVHPHGHDDVAHHEDGADAAQDSDDHAAHEHAGITIYILDGAAKNAVAIEASEITLNLTHDGKPEQFKLAALPESDDPEGKSSRFASTAKDLLEHFHESEHVEGALVLSIGGKSFRGKLAHSHDDDHGHPHDDHEDGEHAH